MDDKQRLQLKQMIKDNDVEDQTDKIREIKHSSLIRKDVIMMEMLKQKHPEMRKHDPAKFSQLAQFQCKFLYDNYTDIHTKIKNDELNLSIFNEFLNVLQRIENEELDQHEGSFEVGKLLKKLYVDSALRKADMNDRGDIEITDTEPQSDPVNISWKEFKTMSPTSSK
jgi:hypothetical protein